MAVSDAQPISAANLKAVLNRGGGGCSSQRSFTAMRQAPQTSR